MYNQSATEAPRKFMCLEDRLLDSLYKQSRPVTLNSLAEPIAITANAASSIVHRIRRNFPDYILIEDGLEPTFAPNGAQKGAVESFLKEGGFTQINEQEFIRYYKKELQREKVRVLLQKLKHPQTWKNWVKGTCLLVGGGVVLAAWHKYKS